MTSGGLSQFTEQKLFTGFTRQMLDKLIANQSKGPMVVQDCDFVHLVDRLEQNHKELCANLFIPDWDPKAVINAAVDIANFAMLIALNANKHLQEEGGKK